jgi:hypothetical protein
MDRVRLPFLCAALLLLTAGAYLPVWKNGFVDFDDDVYLTPNPGVLQGLSLSGVWWAWTNDDVPYWIPVTWLSFQLDAQLFPARAPDGSVALSPAAVHGQSLVWHAAGALLLFGLWHRLTGAVWRSFLVAALFAVHPMHVESVAWAIERKDVLSGFFGLLTVWAYLSYLDRPGWPRYLGMMAAYLVSLLSKPMLMTLPAVLLLLDYWPLGRWGTVPWRRLVREKVPLFVLAAVIAAVTLNSRASHGSLVSLSTIPLPARLANALTAYGWYLSATFWPVRLAALYPHPYGNWSPLGALAGAAALLSLTALALWQARRRPWLLVGWLWFVGMLVPVIGLAQGGAQAWADRFSYWPHIGLFAAVVWGAADLARRARLPALVTAPAGALVLAGLAALTWVQVGYWRDSRTLWEHALAVTKDNDRAHEHVARCYRQEGRIPEAESHLAEATHIQLKRFGIDFQRRAPQSPPPPG